MDRMIYTALSGMDAAMNRQRAVASNLANGDTPGFRSEVFSTSSFRMNGETMDVRSLAQGSVRGANLAAGSVETTGRSLDIAVTGAALIAFQSPDGGEVYSRRGDLSVNLLGQLSNGDGLAVLGEAGPLAVPPGWDISIGSDGTLFARDPAAPDQLLEVLGHIKLATPSGSAVVKDIDGQLRVPGGGILAADPTAEVVIGALEQSNVDTANVLVEMIDAQRGFERRAKLISTAEQIDQASSRLMSLNG